MADPDTRPQLLGDEAELFRDFNDTLMRQIDRHVTTSSPQTVEDACAFAWAQFLRYQPDRSQNWKSWLFQTAQREAWLIERKARGHAALRSFEWEHPQLTVQVGGPGPMQQHDDVQDALELIGQLRSRLQPIALMRALGLTHAEI